MARPVQESPLIGRELELATAVESLRAPDGPGVLIAGSAGVGKSRLAREAALRSTAKSEASKRVRGARLLTVHATAEASELVLGALASLLGPPSPDQIGLSPVQVGLQSLRRIAGQDGQEHRPVILSVDDVHLLDPVSLAVLHQAVTERTVTLLATVRTDRPVPDAVTALWKDAGVVRIDLAPLDPSASEELLTALLGGPVEGRTLRQLRDTAAGNPLFLRELATSAREAGLLDQAGGLWRLTGPMTAVPRLTELLAGRLAASCPAERDALELLAAGEPVPLPVALTVVAEETLEALERRGLLCVGPADPSAVRLSHPLYGELLRAGTPALARRRHLRRLADASESDSVDYGEDRLRIACWRLDAGGPVNPQLMLAAAEQATTNREYALAYRLADRAFQTHGDVAAGLVSVRALVQLGRIDEALARCAALADLVRPAGTDLDRLLVAVEHAEILVHAMDDVPAARGVVERARQDRARATGADPTAAGDPVACPLTAFDLYLRSVQLDCTVIDPSLTVVRSDAPMPARMAASGAAGGALLVAGRYAEAEALMAQFMPLAGVNLGGSQLQAAGVSPAAAALRCYRPDPAAALELAEHGYQASLHPTNPVSQALHALVLSQITLFQGRPRTALRWAREARLVAGEINLRPVCRWSAAVGLQAAAQLGADADIGVLAAELDRYAGGPDSMRLFDIEVARAYAWRGAVVGDGGAGIGALAASVAEHGRLGAIGSGVLGALDLVRLGAGTQAVALLAAYPPDPGWSLGRAIVRYAAAARSADPTGLLDVAQQFAGYGMPLHAAEAAALAEAAAPAKAAALAEASGGDPAAVAVNARLLAEAQLASTGEPASTPALRRRGPVSQLTAREREVALAAARGESARDIAGRLHLSERTVENHLHRAYAKLGITGRRALRTALGLS
ncbi:helix-turn-helix transcriptional regulator [Micromonospora sp. NBC_01813]|uniref:helix-turn-helix transcriptional regulator n=1 Tax=Micromonospora sp. NBC_01813 TaxID=2975988 RepID=UPI002DDA0A5C|nr:LuxR C-terminal-related transcriptional regulator [Micromonospora sp. NBC_01813]WSA07289.1 LuxR C-terminal-related transcriptional regulator [Micromonospora sp. NBC_01813]